MRKNSPLPEGEPQYWITSARSDDKRTAEEAIRKSVGRDREWGLGGERSRGKRAMTPGDWICFYAAQEGVVAYARIDSAPEETSHPPLLDPEGHEWRFRLDSIELFLEKPVVIDEALRKRLDAFKGRDPRRNWSWLVQWSNRVTEHDFRILTGQQVTSRWNAQTSAGTPCLHVRNALLFLLESVHSAAFIGFGTL
jgi:hypothetical protein